MLIRDPQPEDLALVHDSWYRAVRDNCPAVHGCSREFLIAMLDAVLADSRWRVAILCPDEDIPDEIASWAVWRSPTEIFWISTNCPSLRPTIRCGLRLA